MKPRTTVATAAPRKSQVMRPGFEMTADGGSRLFVSLSRKVAVEERRAEGAITYVRRQTSIRVRNDTRALVTEHFNTPVLRARLVPRGSDLHLVVDLRASSTPTWRIVEREDGTADLQIDFPAGTFVAPETSPPIYRLEPSPDRPPLWSTSGEATVPARDRSNAQRIDTHPATGNRYDTTDAARKRGRESLRDKAEQLRPKPDPEARQRWQQAKQLQDRPPPKPRPDNDEQMRALRAKKQANRDAVHREQQELDRQGGPGTAVPHD